MSNACKREFKRGQILYMVDDYRGPQAIATEAVILKVDEKNRKFEALLYGDTHQNYSFDDYGHLFFDTESEAAEVADKLPKRNSIVYHKEDGMVRKKTVTGYGGNQYTGVFDLKIFFNFGYASTKEIGKTVFLNEADIVQDKK